MSVKVWHEVFWFHASSISDVLPKRNHQTVMLSSYILSRLPNLISVILYCKAPLALFKVGLRFVGFLLSTRKKDIQKDIEYEIIGEGSQISTNQKRESTVSWLLIGRNLRPLPDNFVLYCSGQ